MFVDLGMFLDISHQCNHTVCVLCLLLWCPQVRHVVASVRASDAALVCVFFGGDLYLTPSVDVWVIYSCCPCVLTCVSIPISGHGGHPADALLGIVLLGSCASTHLC